MTKRAFFPVVLIAVLVSVIAGVTDYPTSAQGSASDDREISIKTISTRYDKEFQTFHVFGELQNNLKVPVEKVMLNITFFDGQGNSTAQIVSPPYFDSLRPGEKSPFDLVEQGRTALQLRDFAYYKISRIWKEVAVEKEALLKLDVRDIAADSCGYYRISGTVTNLAKNYTSGIEVSAAFYNEQHQILATAFTTISDRIDPTKFSEFTIAIEKSTLPHFAYYSFSVQSDRYSAASDELADRMTNFYDPPVLGGKTMIVKTEPDTYQIDQDLVKISGIIPVEEVKLRGENSLVVIKILGPTGTLLSQVTSPVPDDGIFSRDVDFQIDEGMQGHVFRVRAEYFGAAAENTFAIEEARQKDVPVECSEQNVKIVDVHAGASKSFANETSFLSGAKVKLGDEVTIGSVVDNQVSRAQNVAMIVEVFDEKGIVIYLHAGKFELDPTGKSELRLSWMPEQRGTFLVKSFAISTLDRPNLLSIGPPISVFVE